MKHIIKYHFARMYSNYNRLILIIPKKKISTFLFTLWSNTQKLHVSTKMPQSKQKNAQNES